MNPAWLSITRGDAPLVVSLPHTGTDLAGLEGRLKSEWLARVDCDWWIDHLYDFAAGLGATVIHTSISRTVIDVNRDPSGVSLYPGQITTTLVPADTFEGEALYAEGHELTEGDIAARRATWFDPYHAALAGELERLRAMHGRVVLYDCHSIRSVLPRLFEDQLPEMNLGTNEGRSCAAELEALVVRLMEKTGRSHVVNGRFKGGYITRNYGRPGEGVHALQMELACRSYLREPEGRSAPENWPALYDANHAAPIRTQLIEILTAARNWAQA